MNLRSLYVLVLILSGLLTLVIGLNMLVNSQTVAESSGVEWDPAGGIVTLVKALGASVASIGALQIIAGLWLRAGDVGGANLGLVMGGVLLFIGLASFVGAGAVEILLLDGIRGLLILGIGLPVRKAM